MVESNNEVSKDLENPMPKKKARAIRNDENRQQGRIKRRKKLNENVIEIGT